ncbi:hypothetical protein [Azoarcus taiwanensis]|uniref:Uncharacterized protein n=1 Tax=Azoarcus taiwanensis TaxID=666964 RepID=A0A972F8R9_9RHOO|nr:hypothetical protein [Azoarcus taiwanensis]NMG04107.1 hypothetical protein [Azoarcus taiwanensis]
MRKKTSIRLSLLAESQLKTESMKTGKPVATLASEAVDRAILSCGEKSGPAPETLAALAKLDAVLNQLSSMNVTLARQIEEVDRMSERRILNAVKILRGEK